jgi:lipoprotein
MRKAVFLLAVLLSFGLLFCGCGSEQFSEELEYNTVYPLSAAEYQMAVNQKIAPLITNLQPFMNADSVDEQATDQALMQIETVYQEIAGLNPPAAKSLYQADLLENLMMASDYIEYLSGQSDELPEREFNDILTAIENAFHVSVN